MITCSVCGSENMDGSVYCEDCGARLAGAPQVTATPSPPPTQAPPSQETTAPTPPPAAPPTPASSSGTIVCSACGAENPADETYCEDCGATLSGGSAGSVATPPPTPSQPAEPPPTMPGTTRPRLVVADTKQEFILDKDEVNIGRRSPVDGIFPEIDLTDIDTESYVSRRHGKITIHDSQALYEDLGSSNGSFLNGERLQRGVQTALHDGDRLRLGKTELIFRQG